MSNIKPTYKKVTENCHICVADADTRAALGAKTSRARDLQPRWDALRAEEHAWGEPPEKVRQFIEENVSGYGHASIAEMAELWVYMSGCGWPFSWLMADFPLFKGQEVSTRAVDVTREAAPCVGAPDAVHDLHRDFLDLFKQLKVEHTDGSGGYKFDNIRWALPGSLRTGLTVTSNVRDSVRQAQHIQGLGGAEAALASEFIEAAKAYAPVMVSSYAKGARAPFSTWSSRAEFSESSPEYAVRLYPVNYDHTAIKRLTNALDAAGGRKPKAHLDPMWERAALFDIEIVCSLAAARDWHRHRRCMPWELLVYTNNRSLHINKSAYPSAKRDGVDELMQRAWDLYQSLGGVEAWYAVPFGATVLLKGRATLPQLVYMLELRAHSVGANFEYKRQAERGLVSLRKLLPSDTSKALGLIG